MKKYLITIVACLIAVVAQAATITFTGVVDTVRVGSTFQVGDTFVASFKFNARTRAVTHYTIAIDESILSGKKDGSVYVDNNPAHGSVFYQIIDNSVTYIELQAGTPNGVIPPLDQFNLNDFTLTNNTFGHLTSLPVIQ